MPRIIRYRDDGGVQVRNGISDILVWVLGGPGLNVFSLSFGVERETGIMDMSISVSFVWEEGWNFGLVGISEFLPALHVALLLDSSSTALFYTRHLYHRQNFQICVR